jgi:hypothetical protein
MYCSHYCVLPTFWEGRWRRFWWVRQVFLICVAQPREDPIWLGQWQQRQSPAKVATSAGAERSSASVEQTAATIKQTADNDSQTEQIACRLATAAVASGEAVHNTVVATQTIAEKHDGARNCPANGSARPQRGS